MAKLRDACNKRWSGNECVLQGDDTGLTSWAFTQQPDGSYTIRVVASSRLSCGALLAASACTSSTLGLAAGTSGKHPPSRRGFFPTFSPPPLSFICLFREKGFPFIFPPFLPFPLILRPHTPLPACPSLPLKRWLCCLEPQLPSIACLLRLSTSNECEVMNLISISLCLRQVPCH